LLAGVAVLGVVVVAVYSVYQWTKPEPAQTEAHLTIFTGSAQVERGAATRVAASGVQLREQDVVATGPSSRAVVDWPGGSLTRLDSGTRLEVLGVAYSGGSWRSHLRLRAGKAWTLVRGTSAVEVETTRPAGWMTRPGAFEVSTSSENGRDVTAVLVWAGELELAGALPARQWTSFAGAGPLNPAQEITGEQLADPFALFNGALEAAHSDRPGYLTGNTLEQGGQTAQQQLSPAAGCRAVTLNWAAATMELIVFDAKGAEFSRVKAARPPITIGFPGGATGNWRFAAHDVTSNGRVNWVAVCA
jgi:hypothetical protein